MFIDVFVGIGVPVCVGVNVVRIAVIAAGFGAVINVVAGTVFLLV